jgi:hypothetical protein
MPAYRVVGTEKTDVAAPAQATDRTDFSAKIVEELLDVAVVIPTRVADKEVGHVPLPGIGCASSADTSVYISVRLRAQNRPQ